MNKDRHEQLRIYFEVQDHTPPDEVEAELWRELRAAESRAKLHDGLFDAVEELFVDYDPNSQHHILESLWRAYNLLIDAIESGEAPVNKQVAELQAELAKWPRVYWKSAAPESLESGYRVLSVSGKASHEWMEILVDCDGEEMWAPVDFGLYSSSEDSENNVDFDRAGT